MRLVIIERLLRPEGGGRADLASGRSPRVETKKEPRTASGRSEFAVVECERYRAARAPETFWGQRHEHAFVEEQSIRIDSSAAQVVAQSWRCHGPSYGQLNCKSPFQKL